MRVVLISLAAILLAGCNPAAATSKRLVENARVISLSAAEKLYSGYNRLPNSTCNPSTSDVAATDGGRVISYSITISCITRGLSTELVYETNCSYHLGDRYQFITGTNKLTLNSNSVELNYSSTGQLLDGRNVEGETTMCPPSE
jgi:hypothetical protein